MSFEALGASRAIFVERVPSRFRIEYSVVATYDVNPLRSNIKISLHQSQILYQPKLSAKIAVLLFFTR